MAGLAASLASLGLLTSTLTAPEAQPPQPEPAPEAAPAQPSAPAPGSDRDVVHLKSGGFVRGVVEEYEPGGQVVLRKADGTVRTFEGADVDRVEIGGEASPKPEEPATEIANLEPVPQLDAIGRKSARVHLIRIDDRPGDLVLQKRTGGMLVSGYGGSASGVSWDTVCTSPCDRDVDTSGAYFVNGLNKGPALASKTLNLAPYAGQDVTLKVRGGSTGLWMGGVFVFTAGVTAAGLSSLWFLFDDYSNVNGGIMLAAGTGAIVAGTIMLIRGRHRVTVEPGTPAR